MNGTVSPPAALDPASFQVIADIAYRESGLTLVEEKTSMIQSRLRQRLHARHIADFVSYAQFLQSRAGRNEIKHLISALTTNVSHFFREQHHFDLLLKRIIEPRLADLRRGGRLRIWSAGCSNGQEAFSIAMTLLRRVPDAAALDIRILATDIDTVVITFARAARYPQRLVSGIPADALGTYFTRHDGRSEPIFEARADLRRLVRFKELNLLGPWPMRCRFDAVFCRNVVIYFDQATQDRLWPRLCGAMAPGGYIFLGHSERISAPARYGLTSAGPTTYRASGPSGAPALPSRCDAKGDLYGTA